VTEKNEAVIRRLVDDVWNKGNVKLLDELVVPNYRDHDPVDPVNGVQGFKDVVAKYRNAFPDCRLDIDELFPIGDRVIVRWHYSGTHRNALEGIAPTGRRVTGPGISIHRFEGGRLAESFTTWDALGLMQQLGAVTLPGKTQRAGL
jgi:steroid delta-isomerase-like uncharacterized protein